MFGKFAEEHPTQAKFDKLMTSCFYSIVTPSNTVIDASFTNTFD